MKNLFKPFLMAATVASLFFVSSCTKTCDEGYEGTDCKTEIRAKFIGQWKGNDVCTTGPYNNITITLASSTSSVLNVTLTNLGGFGGTETITAKVNAGGALEFTGAAISGNRTITGTITSSGTSLNVSYTVTPATGTPDVCSGSNYTKL